jgi:hypothetical protein
VDKPSLSVVALLQKQLAPFSDWLATRSRQSGRTISKAAIISVYLQLLNKEGNLPETGTFHLTPQQICQALSLSQKPKNLSSLRKILADIKDLHTRWEREQPPHPHFAVAFSANGTLAWETRTVLPREVLVRQALYHLDELRRLLEELLHTPGD